MTLAAARLALRFAQRLDPDDAHRVAGTGADLSGPP
jgi:hypothetical protein